jgi:hypothetical protein
MTSERLRASCQPSHLYRNCWPETYVQDPVYAIPESLSLIVVVTVATEGAVAGVGLAREGVRVGAEAAVEVAVAPLARSVLGRADDAFEGEPGFFQ